MDKACTGLHWVRNKLQLHNPVGSAEGAGERQRVRGKESSAKITHLSIRAIRAGCTCTAAGGVVLARLARRPPTQGGDAVVVGEQTSSGDLAKEPILKFDRGGSPRRRSKHNSEREIPIHGRQLNSPGFWMWGRWMRLNEG